MLVVGDGVQVFERTAERGEGRERAENIGHGFTLKSIIDYPPVPHRPRGSLPEAVSGDFVGRERIVTGHLTGELRSGPAHTIATTHEVVHRFTAPVLRVRVSPRGERMALVVGYELILTSDKGAAPHVLGKAHSNVAWAADGESLAVLEREGDLVVYDAAGAQVRRVRVAQSANECGRHDASQVGFVVPTTRGLVVVGHDGAVREIPCLGAPSSGRRAGAASAASDGRVVVVNMTWDEDAPGRATELQAFDLANDQVHLWLRVACQPSSSPMAFAPSGDAFAYGSRTHVSVGAWSLDFERDEAAEWLYFVRALIDRRHYALAKLLLERIPVEPHRHALAREVDLQKRSVDSAMPRASAPPAPLPKTPPKRLAPAPSNGPFSEAQVVTHPRFGQGIVQDVNGEGPAARVTVDFDGTERVLPATSLRPADR